jgi:hypothetical protein
MADLFPPQIVFVDDFVDYGVVFPEMRLCFQPAGRVILVHALEEELVIRSKDNAADEATRLTDLIDDLAPRSSVRISRGRDGFVRGIVELINGCASRRR